ncbi:acyltransferase [Romboutsia lituseburensis]|uniref:acyltransferase n=1 Tax=Romboutsia lituseburensis TaxID=1537 RepID=UPI00215B2CDD|nr:acyltransferase [Romboutsia lituseburensis]MCR8744679.1 acyltransferase [Romboutsia lituseburensis]
MDIFNKEKINTSYQKELDLAKGLAILFMVWVHVNEYYQSPKIEGGFYNRLVEFLGSPMSAPIFIILIGVGIVYSRRSTAKYLFKRGISLLLLGYGLNILMDFIPNIILALRANDMSYIQLGLESIFGIDILAFSGLVFLFFSLIKKFNISNKGLFGIWCGLMTLNIFLRGTVIENKIINIICRGIWGTDELSWFPFLSWITFALVGYYFGQILTRCANKTVLYKNILFVTAPLSILLWVYSYVNNVKFGAFGALYQTEYYHQDIMGNIVLCVFALFWISLLYFVYQYIPEIVKITINRWSKNTNLMYCIHYTIIGFSILLLKTESYMPLQTILLAISIFTFTDILCIFINKVKSKKLSKGYTKNEYAALQNIQS